VVLCASGTATLTVGLLEKPMVIMYRMSRLTVFVGRMIVRPPPHFGLINLVLGERVVPELFQEEATPERMSRELSAMIGSDETRRAIRARLARAKELLGRRGATERVARALQPYLDAA
jgi:lipid-A-disaccharide synthase